MTNYEAKIEFHQRRFEITQTNQSGYQVQVSDRTYMINIGHREVKRHIDHIARNHGNVSIGQAENDLSWDISYKPHTANQKSENVLPRRKEHKTYPKRQRNTTKRYILNAD